MATPPAPPTVPPPVAEPPEDELPRRSSRGWVVALGIITVALLGAIAFAAFRVESSKDAATDRADTQANGQDGAADVLGTAFRDRNGRFTLRYPRTWRRLSSRAPNVALVITPGGQDSLLVRILDLPEPIRAEDVSGLKTLTDQAVKVENVQMLAEQPVDVNGASGFYYLYTFKDAAGQQLVHAHYFLFRGSRLHILVFQSTPDGFEAVADTFDKIVSSYQPAPTPAATPAPTPTTAG